jgi:uncharacterized protein YbjT (DUF2867 family)
MENLSESWVAARLRTHGELAQPIPAEAPVRWLALDDLADAVADVLADPEPPARLVLAGPEALTGADVAATLADVLGRPVRWTAVPFAEHRRHVAEHLGADYAAALAAVYGPGAALPPPPAPSPGALRRGRTSLRAWAAARRWDG